MRMEVGSQVQELPDNMPEMQKPLLGQATQEQGEVDAKSTVGTNHE
jgi:hypothetical protein